jgi:EF-hand domain
MRQVVSPSYGILRNEMCRTPADSTSLGSLVSELDDAAPGDATPARDALRAVLAEVFNSHDFNKDGRMDVQEFRAAMRDMGDELSAKVSRCTVAACPCEATSVPLPPFAVHTCVAQT